MTRQPLYSPDHQARQRMVTEAGTGLWVQLGGNPGPVAGALDDLADRGGHPSGPGLEAIRHS